MGFKTLLKMIVSHMFSHTEITLLIVIKLDLGLLTSISKIQKWNCWINVIFRVSD